MSLASLSGWLAGALLLVAALLPIVQRLARGRRASLDSRQVAAHVAIGLSVGAVGLIHPLLAVLVLGSPGAIGGGELGLAFGGLAFLALLAHTGLGLKLRDPKLRQRPRIRRNHVITAITIVLAVAAHVVWVQIGRAEQ